MYVSVVQRYSSIVSPSQSSAVVGRHWSTISFCGSARQRERERDIFLLGRSVGRRNVVFSRQIGRTGGDARVCSAAPVTKRILIHAQCAAGRAETSSRDDDDDDDDDDDEICLNRLIVNIQCQTVF